jgi:hypothetical protein
MIYLNKLIFNQEIDGSCVLDLVIPYLDNALIDEGHFEKPLDFDYDEQCREYWETEEEYEERRTFPQDPRYLDWRWNLACFCVVSKLALSKYQRYKCNMYAYRGSTHKLAKYVASGGRLSPHVCEIAALGGYINCLKFCRQNGAVWGRTVSAAAVYGHIHSFAYAVTKGCPVTLSDLAVVIRRRSINCLAFLYDVADRSSFQKEVCEWLDQKECQFYLLCHYTSDMDKSDEIEPEDERMERRDPCDVVPLPKGTQFAALKSLYEGSILKDGSLHLFDGILDKII